MVYIGLVKTLLVTTPEAKIERNAFRKLVPDKLTGWHIEAMPSGSLSQTATVPDVTVVQLSDETQPANLKAMMPRLAHLQTGFPQGSFVVFALTRPAQSAPRKVKAQQRRLQGILDEINHGLQAFPNPERVDVSVVQYEPELTAKLRLIEAKLKIAPPRPSPLDRVDKVVKATEDLRVKSGNLSAAAIAFNFGVSLNQLARWLGRTRQALSKTPDADSLQDELAFFERVARLRAAVPRDRFLKWLRMPHAELDDKQPLELMATGERQVVADLVGDILTGAPA